MRSQNRRNGVIPFVERIFQPLAPDRLPHSCVIPRSFRFTRRRVALMTDRLSRGIDSGALLNVAPPHESSGTSEGASGGGRFFARIRRSGHHLRMLLLFCLAVPETRAADHAAQPVPVAGKSITLPANGTSTCTHGIGDFPQTMIRKDAGGAPPRAASFIPANDLPSDSMARWFGIFGFALLLTRSARRS